MTESFKSESLKNPREIDRNFQKAKQEFWELAQSRINIDTQEQHEVFHEAYFPKDEIPTSAAFALLPGYSKNSTDQEKAILEFEISINKDFFGDEYADLIPYAIEHEIYEAWLHAKRGWNPQTIKQGHLLARKYQLKKAMADGKAERLVDFYIKKFPHLKDEFEDAYERVPQETD